MVGLECAPRRKIDGAFHFGRHREPRQDAREEHHREIRHGQLVIARRNAAAPFDPREEVLDQEARPEELAVVRALDPTTPTRWDDRDGAVRFDGGDDSVGVVGLVGEDRPASGLLEHFERLGHVVNLPFGKRDLRGISKTVDESVDLRRRTATRSSDLFAPTLFPTDRVHVDPNDRGIQNRDLIVGVDGQGVENPLP